MEAKELAGFRKCLVDNGIISKNLAQEVWTDSLNHNKSFIKVLVETHGILSADIARVAADFFELPLLDIDCYNTVSVPDITQYKAFLKAHDALFPLLQKDNALYVAVYDPNVRDLEEFQFHSGKNIIPILVEYAKLPKFIDSILMEGDKDMLEQFSSEAMEGLEFNIEQAGEDQSGETHLEEDDAPLVRFVQKVLVDAIKAGASDIHFEPYDDFFRVRYRRDGVLYEVTRVSINLASRVTARIKVLSRLDVSEKRIPQDGRCKLSLSKTRELDFRVSTCPVSNGEKVVIRILDPASVSIGIEKLGFMPDQQETFLRCIEKSQGMVLVTGPTGSGKTVTLYSALQILNDVENNISTIEDPIEIRIAGINQVPINMKAGLTFATALRSFLRQDPDILMVGEMRDLETTEIAIKAAQTGHMVFSTLHTNSAAETLTRLIDIGVSPFNIGSSVTLIIAQRLVRKLCNFCKKPTSIPTQSLLKEGLHEEDITGASFFEHVGCDKCLKGYKGRVGVYELLLMTPTLSQAVMSGANSNDFLKLAIKEGMRPLKISGFHQVKLGVTTLEELNRVIV